MAGAVDYLSNITPDELVVQAKSIDAYLKGINPNASLSSLQGTGTPVAGNIFAVAGTLIDMLTIHGSPSPTKEQYTNLAINLIGLVPAPADEAHARMALRPMLALALQAKDGKFSAADVQKITDHLNDKTAGDIETYITTAEGKIDSLVSACAALGSRLAGDLSIRMANAGANISVGAAIQSLTGSNGLIHDPKQTISDWLGALASAGQSPAIAPTPAVSLGQSVPNASLTALAGKISAGVAQAAPELKRLIKVIKDGIKSANKQGNAAVPVSHAGVHNAQIKGGTLEYVSLQALPACEAPTCPAQKQGDSANATCNSITFSSGAERVSHTDFVTISTQPIIWRRLYTSSNAAQERSPFGARWTTPYSAQFIANEHYLSYCGADGRINHYAALKDGQIHHDAINSLNLTRVSATMLVIGRGQKSEWLETYENKGRGDIYRLTMMSDVKNNQTIGIRYDHTATTTGQSVLSDVITKKGQTILSHIRTVINPSGLVTEIWDMKDNQPVKQIARYRYDNHHNLIFAQDENAQYWEYSYGDEPQHHLIHRYSDRTGRGQNIRYDGTSPDARAIREWADDGSFDTQLIYDKRIRKVTVINALGAATEHYYDIYGFTYRSVYANGLSEWFQRDTRKNVIQHTTTNGNSIQYRYDAHDNLVEMTNADGGTTRFQYNAEHQLIAVQDPEGGIWKRDYDAAGNLSEQTDPLGNVTTYEYNKDKLPTVITDAKGGKKQLTYNALGQMSSFTDCSGKTSTWTYDKQGRLLKQANAAGETTQYAYSLEGPERGQLKTITHADGQIETLTHDAEGRLLSHIDPTGKRTSYDYTLAGQVKQRTDAAGNRIGYEWDKAGRLTNLINANQAKYQFQYNNVGQLIAEQAFDGSQTQYQYNATTGMLKQVSDASLITAVAFDNAGRVAARVVQHRETQTKQAETFAYDLNGQLIQATNHSSTLNWYYNLAGQLIREHQRYKLPNAEYTAIWQHEYDVLGNRSATTRPDGTRTEWLTYGSGHVHGLLLNGIETTAFERDDLHREIERTQANHIAQTLQYDPAGRLKQQLINHVDAKQGINTTLNQRNYSYDTLGQLTQIGDTRRGQISYAYDPVGRLLQASSGFGKELFAFDPAGNISDAQTSNPNLQHNTIDDEPGIHQNTTKANIVLDNLLKQYVGTHYEYDERGNMVKRTHNGQVTTFKWNHFNRMVQSTSDDVQTHYAYDALGRRMVKHSQPIIDVPSGAGSGYEDSQRSKLINAKNLGITLYGWDGDTLAWESTYGTRRHINEPARQIEAAFDTSQTTHYVYEPNSFVPMLQATRKGPIQLLPTPDYKAMINSKAGYDIDNDPVWRYQAQPQPIERIAYYQCDHLGTPQELTNEQGDIAWAAHYKAWGEAHEALSTAAKRAGLKQPIRFQGQYHDHETGLHYNRHRYYDPHCGRYLSEDPIGLSGGINVHAYTANPNQWVDPMGLEPTAEQIQTMLLTQKLECQSHGQAWCSVGYQGIGDYMACSGGVSLASGGVAFNLHNGNKYFIASKSPSLSKPTLGASCVVGYILDKDKNIPKGKATDAFLGGFGVGGSLCYGACLGYNQSITLDTRNTRSIEGGFGSPGASVNIGIGVPVGQQK